GDALLRALHVAMDKAAALGAARKAIIFTESRRTQDYLQRILAARRSSARSSTSWTSTLPQGSRT
ncbi:MAG: hypothetical protein M3Q10_07825, partial [Chloroflexota bacterium]|nr:hypothetical protein [Chloroflexota bacterium]